MQYEIDRQEDKAGEPSLSQLTEKAIKILNREPNGFFLLVEGMITLPNQYRQDAKVYKNLCRCQKITDILGVQFAGFNFNF